MADYPLAEKQPSRLRTPSGMAFEEITLEAVMAGRVTMDDLRVTPEALEMQAEIAREAGRRQLAENLGRAAELARIPADVILRVYDALRPGRASPAELLELAGRVERDYGAHRCARLIREAATAEQPLP